MSLKSRFSSVITLAVAVGAFGVVASAQETTPAPKDDAKKYEKRERGFGRHGGERGFRDGKGRHGGMRGGMFGLRGIELTEAQKEQIRQIHAANKPSEALMTEMKSLREARKGGTELTEAQKDRLKAIRQEMKANHESVRAQVLGILTVEQRQQLETKNAERQKRREEFREKRQELRQKREATKPTDDN
jgi:Spy/CpxP family protein refolding chaperone